MTDENEDVKPTSLTQDLIGLDRTFEDTQRIRRVVTEKLKNAAESLVIATDDSKLLESQMVLFSTLLSSLTSAETNASKRASAKLRQAENETASKHSATVADLLAKLAQSGGRPTLGTATPEEIARDKERADAVLLTAGLDPITATELRLDPTDLA